MRFFKFSSESTFRLVDSETRDVHNYECLKTWMKYPDGRGTTTDRYCEHLCWYRPIDAIVEWLYNTNENDYYEG